ncbi:MAG: M23 family metallopeptidase [bacterium]
MARILSLILILSSLALFADEARFPLDESIITGSFGEFRWNHLHAGLDLSTGGVEGKPVYAPVDGWVSYIKRDFTGYGNTVFIEDGKYIYVFAHLQKFNEPLSIRLSENKFRQTIYPGKNEIQVKKGEVFAYTGSSGTSNPHLHFEVRSKMNNPLNPLSIFSIEDREYPYIYGVLFECASDSTLINGKHDNVYIQATKVNDSTFRVKPVNIYGPFSISVKVIDKANSQSAKLFVYEASLQSGERTLLTFSLDSISFELSRKSPLFFRGDVPVKNSNYLFTFRKPFENFLYHSATGILSPDIDTLITTNLTDFSGNTSRCDIPIVKSKEKKKEYDSFVKMKKVNNKIVVLMSGSYAKYSVSEKVKSYFLEYDVDDRYKYFVYERWGVTENGFAVDGLTVKENIAHIDNTISLKLSDSISIFSDNELSFLFNREVKEKRGMIYSTDLFKIQLCDQYLERSVKIILTGYKGKAFYLYNNGVQTFVSILEDSDTVRLDHLRSFIIGNDIKPPKHSRLKKKTSNGYNWLTYSLYDSESGIDWNFVADSNYLYNEPNMSKGNVKIRVEKGKQEFFVIKDKEGNRDTILLNQ